jgi:hypothetical protein
MHADDAVVHLAATAEPLPTNADRFDAALGCSRFIDAADRLSVGMFACNQLLALVADAAFIPLDRLEETL